MIQKENYEERSQNNETMNQNVTYKKEVEMMT